MIERIDIEAERAGCRNAPWLGLCRVAPVESYLVALDELEAARAEVERLKSLLHITRDDK